MPADVVERDELEREIKGDAAWWESGVQPLSCGGWTLAGRGGPARTLRLPSGNYIVFEFEDAEEPAWVQLAIEALTPLLELPPDWNSYQARPVSEGAVVASFRCLAQIMRDNVPMPAFVPAVRGGIQLEWHLRGLDIEVHVLPAGNCRASIEDEFGQVNWEGEVLSDLAPLQRAIVELSKRQ